MKDKTFFVTAIFNLSIDDDLGVGVNIRNGICLTNNIGFIRSLLTDELLQAIGNLEFNALYNAKTIFYKISEENVSFDNHDDLLCDFLYNCTLIINEFWLIKDHSIDIMLGFIQYPYIQTSKIDLPYNTSTIHSNWIATGSYNSIGTYTNTNFDKSDINKIIEWGHSTILEEFTQAEKSKTAIRPGIYRISRANVFLHTARQQADLGIRISHLCSSFECLFSTDSKELTHKLSERVAFFLETNPDERLKIFQDMKAIYAIRSQVTHGSTISKKIMPRITLYSQRADEILRRVMLRLQEDETFDRFYRKENNEELEEFLTKLTLGFGPA